MDTPREVLDTFVAIATASGIQQHTEEWYSARAMTIGGSSMSTIQGENPYCTVEQLLTDKTVGGNERKSALPMNWGTLFEDILRAYVERTMGTEIVADNAFLYGPPGTHITYSPDGIGVIDSGTLVRYGINVDTLTAGIVNHQTVDAANAPDPARKHHIVLFEFKCLFSRIPGAEPPKYYVPQVKTGLDVIPPADYGLLIEAVFRRCPVADMGINIKFDKKLAARKYGSGVLAMGIVGFMHDAEAFSVKMHALRAGGFDNRVDKLERLYARLCAEFAAEFMPPGTNEYEIIGDDGTVTEIITSDSAVTEPTNAHATTQDLAVTSRDFMTTLLECYVNGVVDAWTSEQIIETDDATARNRVGNALETFQLIVAGRVNFGVLPWKLFGVKVHAIHRTRDYIAQWQQQIDNVVNIVQTYHSLPESERARYYQQNVYTAPAYKIIDG